MCFPLAITGKGLTLQKIRIIVKADKSIIWQENRLAEKKK